MLTQQQQWCPQCKRYVETEQKRNKLGRRGNLIKLVMTCQKCRTTLGSKTVNAAILKQMQTESAADRSPSENS